MSVQQLRKVFATALLFAFLPGCGSKTPPADTPPASPTPKPAATPQTAAAAKLRDRLAAVAARAARLKPFLQRSTAPADQGPGSWPVTIRLGPDHRALAPASPGKTATAAGASRYFTVSNRGDWRRVGNSNNGGPVFKSINSLPTLPTVNGGGSTHQVHQNGSRSEYDADDGSNTVYKPDGSLDETFANGDDIHLYGPGGGPDGTTGYNSHADGSITTYNKDGSTTTYNNDGSVDEQNNDGTDTHVYGPGGGPDGAVGFTKGPDGGLTTYFGDGSSTEIPGTKSQDPAGGPNGKDYSQDPAGGPNGKGVHNPDSHGPPGDHPAKGTGEPHYYTRDGTEVTTQAAGEFVLVTGVPGREVQARQQPWGDSRMASAITALALRVGDNKVEVRLDGTALVNGEAAPADAFVQGDLPGGGMVGVWRANNRMTGAVVVWPDLSVVWVTVGNRYLNLVAQWRTLAPEHRGILGSNDGVADNDLTDRAGKVYARGDAPGLAAFVESWRVTDAESLFTYGPGESTATYTLRDFPKNPPDLAAHRAEAEAAAAGLPPGPLRDACVYDIAVTGDTKFAASYQDFAKLSATVQANSDMPPARKKPGAAPEATPAPSPTATPPVESGDGIAITPTEMAAAAPMEAGQQFKLKLGAGESRVYKFTPGKTDNLTIYPADLSSFAAYQPGKDAGYAWFDDKGRMVGKPHQVHDDGPSPLEHPTGTFYLKIVGPGDVDVHHH